MVASLEVLLPSEAYGPGHKVACVDEEEEHPFPSVKFVPFACEHESEQ